MKVLLCVLLCVLPGCAGILTARDEAPVATAAPVPVVPDGKAYVLRIQFTNASPGTDGTVKEVGEGVWPLFVAFGKTAARLPIVGMFFAKKGAEMATRGGNGGGNDGPYGVCNNAIASGRALFIELITTNTEEQKPVLATPVPIKAVEAKE